MNYFRVSLAGPWPLNWRVEANVIEPCYPLLDWPLTPLSPVSNPNQALFKLQERCWNNLSRETQLVLCGQQNSMFLLWYPIYMLTYNREAKCQSVILDLTIHVTITLPCFSWLGSHSSDKIYRMAKWCKHNTGGSVLRINYALRLCGLDLHFFVAFINKCVAYILENIYSQNT